MMKIKLRLKAEGQISHKEVYFATDALNALSPTPKDRDKFMHQICAFLMHKSSHLFSGQYKRKTFIKKILANGNTYDVYYGQSNSSANNDDPFAFETPTYLGPYNVSFKEDFQFDASEQSIVEMTGKEKERTKAIFDNLENWLNSDLPQKLEKCYEGRVAAHNQPTAEPFPPNSMNFLSGEHLPEFKQLPAHASDISTFAIFSGELGLTKNAIGVYLENLKYILFKLNLLIKDITQKKADLDSGINVVFESLDNKQAALIVEYSQQQFKILQDKIHQIKRVQTLGFENEEPLTAYGALLRKELHNVAVTAGQVYSQIRNHYSEFYAFFEEDRDERGKVYLAKELLKFALKQTCWIYFGNAWQDNHQATLKDKKFYIDSRRKELNSLFGEYISIDKFFNISCKPKLHQSSLEELTQLINLLLSNSRLYGTLLFILKDILSKHPNLGKIQFGLGGIKSGVFSPSEQLTTQDKSIEPYLKAFRNNMQNDLRLPIVPDGLENEILNLESDLNAFCKNLKFSQELAVVESELKSLQSLLPKTIESLTSEFKKNESRVLAAHTDMEVLLRKNVPSDKVESIMTQNFLFHKDLESRFNKIYLAHKTLLGNQEKEITRLLKELRTHTTLLNTPGVNDPANIEKLNNLLAESQKIKASIESAIDQFLLSIDIQFEKVNLVLTAPQHCDDLATAAEKRISEFALPDINKISEARLSSVPQINAVEKEFQIVINYILDIKNEFITHLDNTFPSIQRALHMIFVGVSKKFDYSLETIKKQQLDYNILWFTHLLVRTLLNLPFWGKVNCANWSAIYVQSDEQLTEYNIPVEIHQLITIVKDTPNWQQDPEQAIQLLIALKIHAEGTIVTNKDKEKHISNIYDFLSDASLIPNQQNNYQPYMTARELTNFVVLNNRAVPRPTPFVRAEEIENIKLLNPNPKPKPRFPSLPFVLGGAAMGGATAATTVFIWGAVLGFTTLATMALPIIACAAGVIALGGLFGWGVRKMLLNSGGREIVPQATTNSSSKKPANTAEKIAKQHVTLKPLLENNMFEYDKKGRKIMCDEIAGPSSRSVPRVSQGRDASPPEMILAPRLFNLDRERLIDLDVNLPTRLLESENEKGKEELPSRASI